ARHSLGHLLLVLGRYDEAVEQIEGVTTGPHVVDAQINLASAYLQLGRAKEAAAALDRFLQSASADDERRPRVRKQRLQLQSTSVDDETIH
ncbi:MAG: tetratricopeptide repeat protein, partial [Candidatus Latescibacterota bacterium]|nr:tetratricopeptide repeat protein [Candidatus Latescibacterota bacterium]